MRVVAIVQARMDSSRLPCKVMKAIDGVPMIELLLARLSRATSLHQIIVATPTGFSNLPLVEHVRKLGFACEQGSEQDVLTRYINAGLAHQADIVVRITADCPLVDPKLVDDMVNHFLAAGVDYACNNYPPTYPDGLDIEVVSMAALLQSQASNELNAYHREHVTPYIRESGYFKVQTFPYHADWSMARWTVDELEDFEVVTRVFKHFSPDIHFGWEQVLGLLQIAPEMFADNSKILRNEGANMSNGQKLWKRAKRVIPGGNMLLSKRPEMFLPEKWPTYFSEAKGCNVWDIDGNEYIDMCIMGIGTNTLGYGHPEVDAAVMKAIAAGNMSTLNCPEEVLLAERLVELHPWADMVRLARTGGEANAIAIRIARAASGRDNVAFCGYHGWHDWYLSANLADDRGLDGHLLPGLAPNGVPRSLAGTVFPFSYNNYEELESLVMAHNIGVIVMEVFRNVEPADNFLQKVRKLATDRKIVLIFDECTSGFRETFGGLHKKFGVIPDMAMFGKALGNGYAITATIGRRDVMEAGQSTFISSTFWTERIGPVAALKTLEIMDRTKSWNTITAIGNQIRELWKSLADKHGLNISHWGMPALAGYSFDGPHALAYKTLVTQEMLARGYLASNSVYACTSHTPEVLAGYVAALDPVFGLVKECDEGRPLGDLLKSPVCHSGFRRIN